MVAQPEKPITTHHLPAAAVADRYGVTLRTLARWLSNEALAFPRPLVINRRNYYDEMLLRAWERQQIERQLARPAHREGRP